MYLLKEGLSGSESWLAFKSKLVDARSRIHVSFQANRDVFDL